MKDIVYVDENDNEIGSGSLPHALEKEIIRRVSRVILENDKGEILLQKRGNIQSYPYLWNDSVSGHVDVGETYLEAALREMKEEMGIDGVTLVEMGKHYGEEADGARMRKSFNMLYTGIFNGEPQIDQHEVSEAKWLPSAEVEKWIEERPEEFTPGSRDAFKIFFQSKK